MELFVNEILELEEEITKSHLSEEHFAVTEGWKGGLALSGCGISTYVMHGCQCGHKLYDFIKKYDLPPEKVMWIFADTDVLWNFRVNEGYKKLTYLFPNAEMMIYPPKSFLTEAGALNFTKMSPDDWVLEDYDREMVFTKVVSIDTNQVHEQLKIQLLFKGDSAKKKEKELYTKVRAFLEEYALFVPDTGLYYVFNAQSKLWEPMDIDKLTYHALRHLDEPWTFSTTLNTIKGASSHIMYGYDYVRDIFNNPDLIPFSNGCWNIITQTFQEGIKKQDYQCSCLPFDYVSGVAKKTAVVAPKICSWLKGRVGGSEILTNVLIAVMFACILKIQYPQRFLFLAGHSSTGKSTFFLLLTKLMAAAGIYVISADDFSCDFGLEDLADGTRKDLIIFHDIGANVTSKFIDLLRTLISSEGETDQKRVRRKHKKNRVFKVFWNGLCRFKHVSLHWGTVTRYCG